MFRFPSVLVSDSGTLGFQHVTIICTFVNCLTSCHLCPVSLCHGKLLVVLSPDFFFCLFFFVFPRCVVVTLRHLGALLSAGWTRLSVCASSGFFSKTKCECRRRKHCCFVLSVYFLFTFCVPSFVILCCLNIKSKSESCD